MGKSRDIAAGTRIKVNQEGESKDWEGAYDINDNKNKHHHCGPHLEMLFF